MIRLKFTKWELGSELVSEWVTDKHSQWSDLGPIKNRISFKICLSFDSLMNQIFYILYYWSQYCLDQNYIFIQNVFLGVNLSPGWRRHIAAPPARLPCLFHPGDENCWNRSPIFCYGSKPFGSGENGNNRQDLFRSIDQKFFETLP